MSAKKELCLNPSCGRNATTRGLCQSCYHAAIVLVKQGRTTWQKLVEDGKSKPVRNQPTHAVEWLMGDDPL